MNSDNRINDIFEQMSSGKNINTQQTEQAKQKVNNMMNGLSSEQRAQIESILNDKQKTQQLLSTPQAQALFNRLFGGQK